MSRPDAPGCGRIYSLGKASEQRPRTSATSFGGSWLIGGHGSGGYVMERVCQAKLVMDINNPLFLFSSAISVIISLRNTFRIFITASYTPSTGLSTNLSRLSYHFNTRTRGLTHHHVSLLHPKEAPPWPLRRGSLRRAPACIKTFSSPRSWPRPRPQWPLILHFGHKNCLQTCQSRSCLRGTAEDESEQL